MGQLSDFCTCRDRACPLHPSNHDKGCSLCVEKNLKRREIPACFFNLAGRPADLDSFFFEDFAKLVLKKQRGASQD